MYKEKNNENAYTHVTSSVLRSVILDSTVTDGFPDEKLLREYIDQGCKQGDPIYLSVGETWSEVAQGLLSEAAKPWSAEYNGYMLTQYGVPRLQKVLRRYIPKTHDLPADFEAGHDFEVAVSTHGTRAYMFDFGRMLKAEASDTRDSVTALNTRNPVAASDTRDLVAIVPLPGWDYTGVFKPLGYQVTYLPLRRENAFHPSQADFKSILEKIDSNKNERLGLVVINAQHNPTGTNWSEEDVRFMIKSALERKAGILIDDAYFAIHDPQTEATSAFKILAQELKQLPAGESESYPWLAVRSLGKQFHCNGWGIGSAASSPARLQQIIYKYLISRSYTYAAMLQNAMASWLENPESEKYLSQARQSFLEKKQIIAKDLETLLGYPKHAYFAGTCGSYILLEIPPRYLAEATAQEEEKFRAQLFEKTGVLFSPGSMIQDPLLYQFNRPHLRVFLGPKKEAIHAAFERLKSAGYTWEK